MGLPFGSIKFQLRVAIQNIASDKKLNMKEKAFKKLKTCRKKKLKIQT